jgi:glycosyltransferase involved in cell wall biosynthesis
MITDIFQMRHLEYFCHQNRSGYAQAAQDYIYALRASNYDIRVRLLHANPDQISMTPKRYAEIMGMMQKETHPDAIQIIHGIPDKQIHINLRNKSVGFGTFETFDPPEHWVKILNTNDAVIVPSKFNEKVFRHAGVVKPIFHIPHCIDTTLYNDKTVFGKEHSEFTFLFFGTWKKRKGWPQLIEAWFKEFDKSDNVRLVLKTDRITMSQRDIEEIKRSLGLKKDFAPISYETRVLNEEAIPALIKKADCLICPTLGEGFGLPGLQAMALQVPVIITNYSGCQDYANEQTATLIEPSGFIALNELDKIPQFNNKKWAHITATSVAKSMRYAVENKEAIKNKAFAAAGFVAQEFGYKRTAERFDAMLETL